MSRIGKVPVIIPEGVNVNIQDNNVKIEGKLGKLEQKFSNVVTIKKEENKLLFSVVANEDKRTRAFWGLTRSLVNNMVVGVSSGYKKVIEIKGVGYRASVKDRVLTLNLGLSHEVKFLLPEGIEVKSLKPELIEVSGYDKQKIGQFCATLRKLRPPEPYKGKGIREQGEKILRKEGKKK